MKKLIYLSFVFVVFASCKNKSNEAPQPQESQVENDIEAVLQSYPDNLTKVFDAHGGLEAWNEMETLEFSVEKPGGYEITTTDLKDGFTLVEMPEHTIGFDGDSVWAINKGNNKFDHNPETYYNKMFQLYAMPFIVAKEGAKYATADQPLQFEGQSCPGIKILIKDKEGSGAQKDYILYFDENSHKMTWLAYKDNDEENSDKASWHFINYPEWQEVEGLSLPKKMVWYSSENGAPQAVEKEINFVSPMLTTVKMDLRVFTKPETGAAIQ